jgi:hypothetical protein
LTICLVPAPEHSESKYDSGRQQLPAAFVLPGVGGAGGSEVCIFGLVETSHRPSVALLQRCKMAALTASGRHELTIRADHRIPPSRFAPQKETVCS